jgi:hypothetical protein
MAVRKFAFLLGVLIAGCETQSQVVASSQPTATQVALQRGKFDLNCPAATASVLSNQYIQAPGPVMANTVTRTEYTVGVSGCNQRATYIVICSQDTSGCIAGDRQ